MTLEEIVLWEYLRERPLGFKFRRQHPYGPFVLDFYCHAARLAVEVDGGYHWRRRAEDRRRDRWLTACGLTVVRVTNDEVLDTPKAAVARICAHLRPRAVGGPSPSGRGALGG